MDLHSNYWLYYILINNTCKSKRNIQIYIPTIGQIIYRARHNTIKLFSKIYIPTIGQIIYREHLKLENLSLSYLHSNYWLDYIPRTSKQVPQRHYYLHSNYWLDYIQGSLVILGSTLEGIYIPTIGQIIYHSIQTFYLHLNQNLHSNYWLDYIRFYNLIS